VSFAADLRAVTDNAKRLMGDVVKKTALDITAGMVMRAPVELGRLKGNFVCGLGQINTSTSDMKDATPLGEYDKGKAVLGVDRTLQRWKAGQTIYLTNSLPYAVVAEYGLYGKPPGSANGPKTVAGYSRQSPGGFVRLTAQDFGPKLKEAIKAVRNV
jgi:hypothetical protein